MPDTQPAHLSVPLLHRWAVTERTYTVPLITRVVSTHYTRRGALRTIRTANQAASARDRQPPRLRLEPTDWAPTGRLRMRLVHELGAVRFATTAELSRLTILSPARVEAVMFALAGDGLVVHRTAEPGDPHQGWRLCTYAEIRRRFPGHPHH